MYFKKGFLSLLIASLFFPHNVFAEIKSSQQLPQDLTEVGLEALLNFDLEITTVSKKKQKLSEVASAVYIVTQEDIRRSGATHIAEVLRMVPGLNVARFDSNRWAISARGFDKEFSILFLMVFSGKFTN